ncbi:ATP phosphoribosyltransferase chloroplastic [Euphorbia peplus]|nr:ATP phosphoribosyltransferase chloroplastic [Euphorbia peplus]
MFMSVVQLNLHQCAPSTSLFPSSFSCRSVISVRPFCISSCPVVCCNVSIAFYNLKLEDKVIESNGIRLGLPSKGCMPSNTLDLLKDCQLSVKQVNPRQYVAQIPQLSNVEVWFERATDNVSGILLQMLGHATFTRQIETNLIPLNESPI